MNISTQQDEDTLASKLIILCITGLPIDNATKTIYTVITLLLNHVPTSDYGTIYKAGGSETW